MNLGGGSGAGGEGGGARGPARRRPLPQSSRRNNYIHEYLDWR